MSQVTIISNRLPISVGKVNGKLQFYPSAGGLATALSSYITRKNTIWIGWPGIASEQLSVAEKKTIAQKLLKSNCYPVFLSKKQLRDYYSGYCNTIIWPLFHNLTVSFEDHDRYFKAYRQINRLFTETVLALSKPGGSLWVHDYQLLLMPQMLRRQRPLDSIGLFLHIPFPDKHSFANMQSSKKLLAGMLGADLVGFHTSAYASQFLDAVDSLNAGIVSKQDVVVEDRIVRVTDFPIGIDYAKFIKTGNSKAVKKIVTSLKKKYGRKKIILTVDRLDPAKGLVQRLKAYREFLESDGKFHSKVVMVMLVVPSRTEIAEYKKLKKTIELLVSEINNTFGNRKWLPVDYMYKAVPFEELSALYQVADVAFIAPLKDGMNLVAKEYVASHTKRGGVLILSTTAGAAEELKNAILVNPKKRSSMVKALEKSITMPKLELHKRLNVMQKQLSANTVHHWAGSFIDTLQKSAKFKSVRVPYLKDYSELANDLEQADKRLLFLDYDGTLANFTMHYSQAKPGAALRRLLVKLSSDKRNDVVIISGRDKDNMEQWFGKLPVSMVAEHGAAVKKYGSKWQNQVKLPPGWKDPIKKAMDKISAITPGAFTEEKDTSLVWHYRKTPAYYAQTNTVILKGLIKTIVKYTELEVYSGNKVLEVKPRNITKGKTAKRWIKPGTGFILAAGDDFTDEDMFKSLPANAYTIKIGPGKTAARFRLHSVEELLDLLKKLA